MGTNKMSPQGQKLLVLLSLWGHLVPMMYTTVGTHTHTQPGKSGNNFQYFVYTISQFLASACAVGPFNAGMVHYLKECERVVRCQICW